jgi:BASS family bile acid:Na+ symporter
MLIACSPGGSSSNVFSMLARGDVALSVTLTACSSIITLFTVPLIMAWVTTSIGTGADVHLPVGNLLMQNLVFMAVPIAIGLWIAVRNERLAERMHAVLKKLALLLVGKY